MEPSIPQLRLRLPRSWPVEEAVEMLLPHHRVGEDEDEEVVKTIPIVLQSEAEEGAGESRTLATMIIPTVYQSEAGEGEGEVNILKAMTIPTVYLSTSEEEDLSEDLEYPTVST